MSDMLMRALAAAAPPEPTEVVVVAPKRTALDFVSHIVIVTVIALIRGAVISFVAAQTDLVPDFGYWESVWIGWGAVWLFHGPNAEHLWWTRSWHDRARAQKIGASK